MNHGCQADVYILTIDKVEISASMSQLIDLRTILVFLMALLYWNYVLVKIVDQYFVAWPLLPVVWCALWSTSRLCSWWPSAKALVPYQHPRLSPHLRRHRHLVPQHEDRNHDKDLREEQWKRQLRSNGT